MEKSCTFAVQKPERSVAPEAKSETQTKLERCRSGRSGRSRKPLYPYGYPGFESLSFRKKQPLGLLFFVESRDENSGRVRDRLRRFRSSAEKVIALALGSTKNPCLSANNPSNTAVGQNTYGGNYFIYIQKHIQIPWESTTHTKASVS